MKYSIVISIPEEKQTFGLTDRHFNELGKAAIENVLKSVESKIIKIEGDMVVHDEDRQND